MTTIKQADLIQSIADALQFISYYHPLDYIQAVGGLRARAVARRRRTRWRRS
jgi:tartrate dehydratase alpha subunit/fumarate hydratase class I-like protein